ncbi:MAG: hypothetical protein LBL04_11375 [Bacteroidales bacterium]|jgi:hypothetical protein|nr:hypothetical protein [Bacteroidales bacterium]
MSEIDKFSENIFRIAGGSRQAQLRFAVCRSVDWEDRTMTAVGVSDEVPYEGVQLGFGYIDVKPKVDTVCLIGILEGREALSFLINAEDVELVEVKADRIVFNGGKLGVCMSDKIAEKLNALKDDLNSLKTAFKGWTVALNDGGGALKTATLDWANRTAGTTNRSDIEDAKILHG